MSRACSVLVAVLVSACAASAGVVLTEDFEQQGKWKKSVRGQGSAELVAGGVEGKCLKVTSKDRALAYYSIELDPKPLRGKRLVIRAKVRLENVVLGPQSYSTAKLHVGVSVGGTIQHRAQRFVGTRDWHDQVLVAPIPEDARRVVLDLGIQNGTGTAWFDSLVVTDGVMEHEPISIRPAANASYRDQTADDGRGGFIDAGPLDLRHVPVAEIRLAGVDFYVMLPGENYGRTCVALRGKQRPALPDRIETAIPVDKKGSRLFFLQAAAWADVERKAPCLICEIHYADGKTIEARMVEGVDIGPLENPRDLPNWKVAWRAKQEGRSVGLGVTAWRNPRPDVAIRFIRLASPGDAGVPVVVAISLDAKGE